MPPYDNVGGRDVGETGEYSKPFLVEPIPLLREISMVAAIVSAQLMVQACLAQGILPGEVIAQNFGESSINSSWGPASYALTSGKPCVRALE